MGDFDWNLDFAWSNLPSEGVYQNGRNREIDPIPTPIVPLGVFVVHQSFFWKIGSFDLGMEIWGNENIEISFRKVARVIFRKFLNEFSTRNSRTKNRTWMCGGNLAIIPCSHVGHIYRTQHPYSIGINDLDHQRNGYAKSGKLWDEKM